MKGEVRDEASGLDKRKNQRKKICILFMAMLANKEWWPDDQWGLGVQKKRGESQKEEGKDCLPLFTHSLLAAGFSLMALPVA